MPRYTLANGTPPIVLGPFLFDPTTEPNLVSVVKSNFTTLTITADVPDTKSIRIKDKAGAWQVDVNGPFAVVDVSLADSAANAGLGSAATKTYVVTAFAEPVGYVTGSTPKEEREVIVSGPTAPAASATWDTVTVSPPASNGSADISIGLKATAFPASWSVKLYIAESATTSSITPTVDETANLTPVPSGVPTALTAYAWTSSFSKVAAGAHTRLVTLKVKAELRDNLGAVVDTRNVSTSWYTGSDL
jgi:hypothetical protein